MPLGSLRMSDRFLESDPPTAEELKALRRLVSSALTTPGSPSSGRGEDLVGIGGTVRNLAKIDLKRDRLPAAAAARLLPDGATPRRADRGDGRTLDEAARRRCPGLNPDRADTIVGGALVVRGVMQHVGAGDRSSCPSRGLREGLALHGRGRGRPVARLGAHDLGRDARRAVRHVGSGAGRAPRRDSRSQLHEALDPAAPRRSRRCSEHAATLLDVGRAIDYYDRFEHAAMIVTAADLAGFTHADLGALTAILRQADDDTRLGPYGRLIDPDDRQAVLKAATALTLADELNRRIPPGAPAPLTLQLAAGRVRGRGARPAGLAPTRRRGRGSARCSGSR